MYIRGVKHEARGLGLAKQRFQTGPLGSFGKCEEGQTFWTRNCIFIGFTALAADMDIPRADSCYIKVTDTQKNVTVYHRNLILFTMGPHKNCIFCELTKIFCFIITVWAVSYESLPVIIHIY